MNIRAITGYRMLINSTGKQIILDINEDEARARQVVARMCETLLVNTVIGITPLIAPWRKVKTDR